MIEELNYLSEKIEIVERGMRLIKLGMPSNICRMDDYLKLQKEKQILENILNKLNELELV